ncbi:MAG: hypothetical protein AB1489_06380 [Acidobacteriota bacterium]
MVGNKDNKNINRGETAPCGLLVNAQSCQSSLDSRSNEQAFSLLEILVVLLMLLAFATAALIYLNRVVNHYDLTRLTSEVIGQLETVRAECIKQNDGFPAAALMVATADNKYAVQYYYYDNVAKKVVHVDYNYLPLKNYRFQVTPATVTYTFNPRGKALAYGNLEYNPAQRLAMLPAITIEHTRDTRLKRIITLTVAGNISVQ